MTLSGQVDIRVLVVWQLSTPWVGSMSPTPYPQDDGAPAVTASADVVPPTVAAFSPSTISGSSLASRHRSTIIVHRKSPLLVATPPPVTRALAYSHAFLLPLNRLVGLLSWSTGDPWESFLLVAGFWSIVLYGDVILLWAGPILVVVGLILAMYSRRYSPLSSTGLTGEKHGSHGESSDAQHHKSLDEIVETLRTFTTRCNILLDPLVEFTDFLSTQRTATSATTRPALTALMTRIVLITPVWILLTLPPIHFITARRVVLSVGTIIITWHSKPARISRVILWRSLTVRRICSAITGLSFALNPYPSGEDSNAMSNASLLSLRPFRRKAPNHNSTNNISMKKRRADSSGVRFTFIIYENQRRWLGIGWTYSLFAYERAAWTDEHLNPTSPKDDFELPEVEGGNARWRWVPGSNWRIDTNPSDVSSKKSSKYNNNSNSKSAENDEGWIYYDNKWSDGRRGQDGWGRYTRRRKWCRDAELVEITPSTEVTPPPSPGPEKASSDLPLPQTENTKDDDASDAETKSYAASTSSKTRKRRWFGSSELTKALSSSPGSASSLPNIESSSTAVATGPDSSYAAKPSSNSSNVRATSTSYSNSPGANSFDNGGSSSRNSLTSRRMSKAGSATADTDKLSLSRSIRDQEIEDAENIVDRIGIRPGGAAERAERGWGLGDDAHMGLS